MITPTERAWVDEQFCGDTNPPDQVTAAGMFQLVTDSVVTDEVFLRYADGVLGAFGLDADVVEDGRGRLKAGEGIPVDQAARAIRGHR